MKKIMAYALCANITLAISGCTTFSQIESGLRTLEGKHQSRIFRLLGPPYSSNQSEDGAMYSWYTEKSGSIMIPVMSSTFGSIGSIPVQSNSKQIIQSTSYSGNIGGCIGFGNVLGNYAAEEKRLDQDEQAINKIRKQRTEEINETRGNDTKESNSEHSLQGRTVSLKLTPYAMYSEPNRHSNRVQILTSDDRMVVLEEHVEWLFIETNDKTSFTRKITGWIHKAAVKRID